MRKYLIYKTSNKNDGKYYIGAHETSKEKDSYLGSGIHLKRAIKKYGRSCFIRETLVECKSREEMFAEEQKIIRLHLGNPLCYNLKDGGIGGWNYVNQSGMMLGKNNPMKNVSVAKKCTAAVRKTNRSLLQIAKKHPKKIKEQVGLKNFVICLAKEARNIGE